MPNQHCMLIPGVKDVALEQNDELTITFKSQAKFCISTGSANDFDPPLPVDIQQQQGYVWTGKAIVPNATITYTHETSSSQGLVGGTGPHTIQIGDGVK
jgi:hypothetical protein